MNPLTRTGKSFEFLGNIYPKSLFKKLEIGDEVIIHPIVGKVFQRNSQATKPYPAKIVAREIKWDCGTRVELTLIGVRENAGWNGGYGAVLNEYGFSRLEFVRRQTLAEGVKELLK